MADTVEVKKVLIGAGLAIGGAFLAKRFASSCSGFDIERMIERMPDDAPPKWMFRNISAIRENTDHIVELLESEKRRVAAEPTRTAA
jgi:hypothetical protein